MTMCDKGTGADVFVARQPVFDPEQNVYGYELLFRSGLANAYDGTDADASTRDVIANSSLAIGLDELTGQRRGFINFTEQLLLDGVPRLLPKELLVVEVLENLEPTPELLEACRRLRDEGYVVALDDFVLADRETPFLDVADIVKVDFLGTSPEERTRLAAELGERGIKPLAEKVETAEEFEQAVRDGYAYFQGYFFSKPVIHQGKTIEGNQLTYLRMLEQINRPELSYEELEATIKTDVSLTYKLLKFMNSAWFGLRYEVTSIKHALVLLGPKEIRKWCALVALRNMGTDKPDELLRRGMTRAKMSELVAPLAKLDDRASELFLMGMFSVLDAILDMPMPDILAKLPLDESITAALLGEPGTFRSVHDTITAYEGGDWDRFASGAGTLGVDEALIPQTYSESLRWTDQAFASVAADD